MAPSGIWGLKQKSLKRITPNPPVKLVLPQRIFIASVSYYPFSIPYLSVSTSANLGDLPERMIDSHPYRVCTFGHHPFLACDCSICPVTTKMGQEVSTAIVIDGFVSKIFHSALFVKQRLYLALNQGLFMLIYSLVWDFRYIFPVFSWHLNITQWSHSFPRFQNPSWQCFVVISQDPSNAVKSWITPSTFFNTTLRFASVDLLPPGSSHISPTRSCW